MTHRIAKIGYIAAITTAVITLGIFYAASNEDGADAKWLFRLGITTAIAALLLCVVAWLAGRMRSFEHKIADLESTITINQAHYNADRTEILRRLNDVSTRFDSFHDEVACRLMMKQSDDELLRSIFDTNE